MAITVQGFDKLEVKFDSIPNEARAELRKELNGVAFSVRGYIVKKLRNLTGSKTVERYDPTRTVRVSAYGSYPNSDRGNLIKRLGIGKARSKNKGSKTGGIVAEIISGAEYSEELDKTRPFLSRAVWAKRKYIESRIRAAIKRSTK